MKLSHPFRRGLIWRIQSLLKPVAPEPEAQPASTGRGESLFRLHETQNRVITSIYKISICGLIGIFLILLSFTLFMISDPGTPTWVAYLLAVVEVMLLFGSVRTLYDFQAYQKHYKEVSARLRDLMRQQFSQNARGKGGEHRLISALKPKEHDGWDAKFCQQCEKSLELTVSVCQHCGQEQDQILMN